MSRTQRNPAPRRRGTVFLLAVGLVVLTAAAVAQVWTHLRAIEHRYDIAKAQRVHSKLRERNRRLRLELALLKSPERLAKVAKDELGLTQPEPEQIHRLRCPRALDVASRRTTTTVERQRTLSAGLFGAGR